MQRFNQSRKHRAVSQADRLLWRVIRLATRLRYQTLLHLLAEEEAKDAEPG